MAFVFGFILTVLAAVVVIYWYALVAFIFGCFMFAWYVEYCFKQPYPNNVFYLVGTALFILAFVWIVARKKGKSE